jgi:hypothetical protein
MNTLFQQTANCQFTICLTRGVHPTLCQVRCHELDARRPCLAY